MTEDLRDAYKQVKRKNIRLDERAIRPGRSLYEMGDFVAMLDKNNVLSIKEAKPLVLEQDPDEEDEDAERQKVKRMKRKPAQNPQEESERLKKLLREPQSDIEVRNLVDQIVQLEVRRILSEMDNDKGRFLPVVPLPLTESLGRKTEWSREDGKCVERLVE